MSDLKHYLRKQEFPVSSREALMRLEKLCLSTSPQQQRVIQEVIEEFVFCEARRGIKKNRLSAVQELQLLDVLSTYFVTRDSVVVRNTVFLTLFLSEGNSASNRMKVLTKLVSMAIATKCVAVLECTSIWMQQHGCMSGIVLNLAHELVKDYLSLFPKTLTCLLELPLISLAFTAHFITAVTATYRHEGSSKMGISLPLLSCVTDWVVSNPQLCITPLVTNLQNCLPKGSIVMPAGVPTTGLIRWCVEAPLVEGKGNRGLDEERKLYSQLHLAVLETMLEAEKLQDQMIQKDVILIRDFMAICDGVAVLIKSMDRLQCGEAIQLALDRLAQVLEVALNSGCLRGNLDELRAHLMRLPHNR